VVIQSQGLVNDEISALMEQHQILATATKERLVRYSDELIVYYTNLHPILTFSVQNFRIQAARGDAGTFLLLHLWFNAVSHEIQHCSYMYD